MAEILLRPMSQEQFDHFRLRGSEMYALSSPHYREMAPHDAIDLVLKDFDSRIAPQGFKTQGQHFIGIFLGEEQIGWFHFGEFPKGSHSVYGWNFHIFEHFQRRGYGEGAIEKAKVFLKDQGYKKIALNVMYDNPVAIRLYEKFGFAVTQVSMERKLG